MDWLMEWIRNLAFFFIFLSVIMNILPSGEEKKYIRFFMGMLLLLVVLRPFLQWRNLDQLLKQEVIGDFVEEAYQEMLRECGRQELAGADYVKHACAREMDVQMQQLMESYGYEVKDCRVDFFEGDAIEVKRIAVVIAPGEKKENQEGDQEQEMTEFLKKKLENVYNLPTGNININIQG